MSKFLLGVLIAIGTLIVRLIIGTTLRSLNMKFHWFNDMQMTITSSLVGTTVQIILIALAIALF